MKASVIIPTYNRGSLIIKTLKALSSQTLPAEEMEVIIVDDGSTDTTGTEVEQYIQANPQRQWRYLYRSVNRGKASVCNLGILSSKSSLIVFTDDDCVPQPDWVEMHVKRHSETNEPISVLGAVTMPLEWIRESNFVRYQNSRYIANRSTRSVGGDLCNLPPNYFGGANISVPHEQLLRVGLFDDKVGRGQDVELGYRLWKAGVKLVYDPRPLLVHYSPEVRSMQNWLSKFAKAYRHTIPLFNEFHPEYVKRFGHWFLEPAIPGSEPLKRTVLKWLIRLFVHKKLAKPMRIFLERTDQWPLFYSPLMYKYVTVSACLDSVNQRK